MERKELNDTITLDRLPIGSSGVIRAVGGEGPLRLRKVAPMGDPLEIHIRGYELTLRAEDARNILVAPETEAQA